MDQLEDLANRFLKEEGFSLQNALAYAGLGLSKTTGSANEIVSGIGFAEHQYSPELQVRMSEILGEQLFYWHVLASTTGMNFHQIIEEYMHSYEAIREKLVKDKVTIQDMMNMRRHVKAEALQETSQGYQQDFDNQKNRKRERLLSK